MIKKGLYDRYVPDVNIESSTIGNLHRGHDSLLKRDILIYTESNSALDMKSGAGRRESSIPMMVGPSALQVLDRGETEDKKYYILEYIPGLLLKDAVKSKKLSLKETIGMAVQFIRMLEEAGRNGSRGIVLSEGNLWLTEEGSVKLINSWTAKPDQTNEIEGVLELMHFMMFGKVEIRLPISQIIEEIALAFQGNPYMVRKSLKAIIRREQKKSNEQYEEMLKQTLEDFMSLYQYVKKNQVTATRKHAEYTVSEQKQENRKPMGRKARKFPVKYLAVVGFLIIMSMAAFSFFANDKGKTLGSTAASGGSNQAVQQNKLTGIEVPDVSGLSLQEAGSKLDASGIRYKYYLESSFREKGTVFKQSPEAGQTIRRTDIVSLWVSE